MGRQDNGLVGKKTYSVSLIRNDRIVRRQERIDVMDDRGMDELPSGWTTGAAKGIAAHRHSP